MRKTTKHILAIAAVVAIFAVGYGLYANSSMAGDFSEGKTGWKINWENKNKKYNNFTDLGNYVVLLNDCKHDEAAFAKINKVVQERNDANGMRCTATVKKNSKGEVVFGRNMDVEISQCPAFVVKVKGAKHTAMAFTYLGSNSKYKYDELEKLDKDSVYLKYLPYVATDAFNETGFFVEVNQREIDKKFLFGEEGSNPKAKERASVISLAALLALNCSTVDEAVEYLKNSYNWYPVNYVKKGGGSEPWGLACLMGDAKGNYGLVEFGKNGVYYTPYQYGQGNYYIHPELAEYTISGSGYGRLAAAQKGLPKCETERDMMDNMKNCMWKREILDPGCMGYSDYKANINDRRAKTQEELKEGFTKFLAPLKPAIEAYYAGNEKALRDDSTVWTTGFNFGVNCATKHLLLRLWEKDSVIYEYQW